MQGQLFYLSSLSPRIISHLIVLHMFPCHLIPRPSPPHFNPHPTIITSTPLIFSSPPPLSKVLRKNHTPRFRPPATHDPRDARLHITRRRTRPAVLLPRERGRVRHHRRGRRGVRPAAHAALAEDAVQREERAGEEDDEDRDADGEGYYEGLAGAGGGGGSLVLGEGEGVGGWEGGGRRGRVGEGCGAAEKGGWEGLWGGD